MLYDEAFNIAKIPKYDDITAEVLQLRQVRDIMVVVLKMVISQTKN